MIRHQQAYQIDALTDWKGSIHQAVLVFQNTHGVYPNIFECNEHTGAQFDFLVNNDLRERDYIRYSGKGSPPKSGDELLLSGFHSENYQLEFATDAELPDMVFRLVYDDEPEWDRSENDEIVRASLNLSEPRDLAE